VSAGPAAAESGGTTAGASGDGKAHAHASRQAELAAIQPAEWLRLQHDLALPEGQQDIPLAKSGCSGAPYDAQTAASANTARMTRPLKVKTSYHEGKCGLGSRAAFGNRGSMGADRSCRRAAARRRSSVSSGIRTAAPGR
jgi:hypothetical protein